MPRLPLMPRRIARNCPMRNRLPSAPLQRGMDTFAYLLSPQSRHLISAIIRVTGFHILTSPSLHSSPRSNPALYQQTGLHHLRMLLTWRSNSPSWALKGPSPTVCRYTRSHPVPRLAVRPSLCPHRPADSHSYPSSSAFTRLRHRRNHLANIDPVLGDRVFLRQRRVAHV